MVGQQADRETKEQRRERPTDDEQGRVDVSAAIETWSCCNRKDRRDDRDGNTDGQRDRDAPAPPERPLLVSLWGALIRSEMTKRVICRQDRVCAPHSVGRVGATIGYD